MGHVDNAGISIFTIKKMINQQEFNIYEYIFKNGSQTAIELSSAFGLTRATIYRVLENLIENRLIVKDRNVFKAFHPDVLIRRLSDEESRITKQKEILNNLSKNNFSKKIKLFFDDKYFSSLNRELRKSPVKVGYIFLNSDFIPKELISRRSKEKFNEDVIIDFSNKEKFKQVGKRNIRLKYKHQKKFVAISIFGKKVALYSVQKDNDNVGILIEDEGIANMLIDVIDFILESKK